MVTETKIYHEGKTDFFSYFPSDIKKGFVPTNLKVFFNPVMNFNRDISLLMSSYLYHKINKKLSICEPLSGCGVRGIRFGNEIPENFDGIFLNDNNYYAYNLIKKNIQLNNLSYLIKAENQDANYLLNKFSFFKWNFDYIDLDPFGSPVPFLNSAIRSIKKNNSILALTATDMSVLCGLYPLKSLKTYGGFSLRTEYCHEIALRLLLHKLNHELSLNENVMKPLLSYYSDHYIRVYVMVSNRNSTKNNLKKFTFIEHCFNCLYRSTFNDLSDFNKNCPSCGKKLSYAGPIWSGNLSDNDTVTELLSLNNFEYLPTYKRIKKILKIILEEDKQPITFYNIHNLCDTLQISVPKMDLVINKIRENGYKISKTHFNPKAIKTDAPFSVLRKILISF